MVLVLKHLLLGGLYDYIYYDKQDHCLFLLYQFFGLYYLHLNDRW